MSTNSVVLLCMELDLFTPITEGLPPEKTQGFAYRHDRVLAGQFRLSIVDQVPVIDIGFGHWEEYTHWLDLSKLTLKETAVKKLAEMCHDSGLCHKDEITDELDYYVAGL